MRKLFGQKIPAIFDKEQYSFCWIVDFPMYEIGEESGELEFCHNPFSMPQGGLQALCEKDPLDIYAYQYDLVCNGVELSSGAVRNSAAEACEAGVIRKKAAAMKSSDKVLKIFLCMLFPLYPFDKNFNEYFII